MSSRQQMKEWLRDEHRLTDFTPEVIEQAKAMIESKLQAQIEKLLGFADQWRVTKGSVRLPWQRTFEVDFDLERI